MNSGTDCYCVKTLYTTKQNEKKAPVQTLLDKQLRDLPALTEDTGSIPSTLTSAMPRQCVMSDTRFLRYQTCM